MKAQFFPMKAQFWFIAIFDQLFSVAILRHADRKQKIFKTIRERQKQIAFALKNYDCHFF